MDVVAAPTSGDPETDALVEGPIWSSTSLSFSFPTLASQFTGYAGGEPAVNFEALNPTQQAAVRAIFASISSFANLTFSEVTGASASTAVLRFGMSDAPETAHAYLPSATELGGDSWYNNSDGEYDNPVRGNYAWVTFEHEIGHALGLGHPHEATPPMPMDRDSLQFTVMSYRSKVGDSLHGYSSDAWGFPQSYMVEDIAALQFLYGANYTYRSTGNLYLWSPTTGELFVDGVGQGAPGANVIFQTVWDGGGIDTFDLSNHVVDPNSFGNQTVIDLRPGEGSYLQTQRADLGTGPFAVNFFTAALYHGDTRSLIENAIGTNGRDLIRGNEAANRLEGNGGGFDELYGFGGDDILTADGILQGGDGNDVLSGTGTLSGDAGNDTLSGGGWLSGGAGNDLLTASDSGAQLKGNEGEDRLVGAGGNDTLDGGDDADTLSGGAGNDSLFGGAGDDVLTAGDGNDTLEGGNGNDVLKGGLGDDTYSIGDTSDQIVELAGEGTDTVQAYLSFAASDTIENIALGGQSAINAIGNALNNVLSGNGSANILDGGAGADTLYGYMGDDIYYVDDPNDLVYEQRGLGTDIVYASTSYVLRETPQLPPPGPGYDPYAGASLRPEYTGENEIERLVLTGSANLSATGNTSANTLEGNSGANVLNGMAGADTLIGGAGADQLIGGAGADVFLYQSTADTLAGQEDWLSDFEHGTDAIDLRQFATTNLALAVFESGTPGVWTRATVATQGGPTMSLRIAGVATQADFLVVHAAVPPQTIIGTAGDDVLVSQGGADTLLGLAGNDTLVGNASVASTMQGGTGDDWYFLYGSGDSLVELAGQGNDRLLAGASYTLSAGREIETLTTLDAAGTAAVDLTGNELGQIILGNAGANVLSGGGGSDTLLGLAGNDTLVGNANAASTLQGGTGDDWYFVFRTGDSLVEFTGEGNDRLFAGVNYTLSASQAIETLSTLDGAGSARVDLTGNELSQIILGNAGANVLSGGGGSDILLGLGGNDILVGNADAASTLQGGTGDDWYFVFRTGDSLVELAGEGSDRLLAGVNYILSAGQAIETLSTLDGAGAVAIDLGGNELDQAIIGNAGANVLSGGGGSDTLLGLGGNDTLYGGDGDDQLAGGLGADTLDGGAGADLLVFSDALGGGNVDSVAGFTSGQDRLLLENDVFAGLGTGGLAVGAFAAGTAAADADDRIVYNSTTGSLWFDADGNGAGAAVLFATFTPGATLAAADIVVV
jgi:serralysin